MREEVEEGWEVGMVAEEVVLVEGGEGLGLSLLNLRSLIRRLSPRVLEGEEVEVGEVKREEVVEVVMVVICRSQLMICWTMTVMKMT